MAYSVFGYFYDSLTKNIDYKKRAEYFNTIIEKNKPKGNILLDLACGTGSLSIELSRYGFDIVGVDGSEEMLSAAMQKDYDNNKVQFLLQRMEDLNMFGTIDIAICALDSLNHVTDKDTLQKIFDRVSLFSNPDGIFIFDVNSIYKHKNVLADTTFVYDCEDVYCVWQNSSCNQENIINISLDFFEYEDGAYFRSEEEFSERAYSIEEITKIANDAGFDVLDVFADDTFEKPTDTTQRLVFVTKQMKEKKVNEQNCEND